ncbi:MAG: plasmid partitioning protein RepB [Roseobacter sp.]|nr:plasmid partitioning protein RepB [Roseobacter sp.]MBV49965.1 plasmid partitioning protein RepB [Roseobacter sp.]MBV50002.1 plasmid partitioning protein RepB [Roseobacter sp.]
MMTTKKTRMSMLDGLASPAQSTTPTPDTPMMSTNRALRSARDAVDSHQVWELDPDSIEDGRIADRLDPDDVVDLRHSIEANGQTVPILVRRHPSVPDRYLLVYGHRRLQAIRDSYRVKTVRALIANLDEDAAVRAQISENTARRDLSFIERALFAQDLVQSGFGNQMQVAEVLNVTRSSISMAITIAEQIGRDLIRTIGAAHGIGRPRWEALGKAIETHHMDRDQLIKIAGAIRNEATVACVVEGVRFDPNELSVQIFDAVMATTDVPQNSPKPAKTPRAVNRKQSADLTVNGKTAGKIVRSPKGVSLDLEKGPFADWIEAQSQDLIEELHARWLQRRED